MKGLLSVTWVFVILLASASCDSNSIQTQNLEKTINLIFKGQKIADYSFVIIHNQNVTYHYNNITRDASFNADSILQILYRPLFLSHLIATDTLSSDHFLMQYMDEGPYRNLRLENLLSVNSRQHAKTVLNTENDRMLQRLISKVASVNDFDKFVASVLEFPHSKIASEEAFLKSFVRISSQLDSITYSSIFTNSEHIPDLYPTWWLHDVVRYYGWQVLKLPRNTLLWNIFQINDRSILFLKSVELKASVCVIFNHNNERRFTQDELLHSPVAIKIVDAIFNSFHDSRYVNLENFAPLHLRTILADAYLTTDDYERDSLFKTYRKTCETCPDPIYLLDSPIAGFSTLGNYHNGFDEFTLDDKTKVDIFSVGQFKIDRAADANLYQIDNIEIFIDSHNNRLPLLNESDNHSIFRFNYRYKTISGLGLLDSIKFAFHDPNDSIYMLEVQIPWTSLGRGNIKAEDVLGLNIFVGDSDSLENVREQVLSLALDDINDWNHPNKYGSIRLSTIPKPHAGKDLITSIASQPPLIDGRAEDVWEHVEFAPLSKSLLKKLSHDHAYVKALWDVHNLYFLFVVEDKIKHTPGLIAADRYWLEDADTGDMVWRFANAKVIEWPTAVAKTSLILPRGRYRLICKTDDRHSFEGWYGKTPPVDSYGVQIFKVRE